MADDWQHNSKAELVQPERRPRGTPREERGRLVRKVWVNWACEQTAPKPSWLLPWEQLDDAQHEVDMRIGDALFALGRLSAEDRKEPATSHQSDVKNANLLQSTNNLRKQIARAIASVDLVEEADERRGNLDHLRPLAEKWITKLCGEDDVLREERDAARAQVAELKATIADIDRHATPVGLLNNDDPEGSPHHYLVTTGSLHRALSKAHTAEPCEAERKRLRAEIEQLKALTAACTCEQTYATYAGPEPDCPVHGAVRAFNEASAKVAELTRQLDEAHTSNTRLMQENQSRIGLEVTLRNDIIRLVTAALGSWDDMANADEQIAQAEQRIREREVRQQ